MVIHPGHYGNGSAAGMGVHGPSCIRLVCGCRIENGGYGIGDKMVFNKKQYICEISKKICNSEERCDDCIVGNYFLNFDIDKLYKIYEDYEL